MFWSIWAFVDTKTSFASPFSVAVTDTAPLFTQVYLHSRECQWSLWYSEDGVRAVPTSSKEGGRKPAGWSHQGKKTSWEKFKDIQKAAQMLAPDKSPVPPREETDVSLCWRPLQAKPTLLTTVGTFIFIGLKKGKLAHVWHLHSILLL